MFSFSMGLAGKLANLRAQPGIALGVPQRVFRRPPSPNSHSLCSPGEGRDMARRDFPSRWPRHPLQNHVRGESPAPEGEYPEDARAPV